MLRTNVHLSIFFSFAEATRRIKERQATFVDPSYAFNFRTDEYSRREEADIAGKVGGVYSFIDDVGEKHLVRYAASADHGFEVLNSVPDASRYVRYGAPLYKTSPKVRGRIAYERGRGRQYKFISSGPDQRRTESTGPDGITRGLYSYLDDKGVQRTTQYIAGPRIGYRVVQETTGVGTHLLPRPSQVEFGILYPAAGGSRNSGGNDEKDFGFDSNGSGDGNSIGKRPDATGNRNGVGGNRDGHSGSGGGDDNSIDGFDDGTSFDIGSGGGSFDGDDGEAEDADDNDVGNRKGSRPNSSGRRPTDWPKRGRFSVIRNRGNTYFGIPPGATARAHVQNIDLLPYGEIESPSAALRRDERTRRFRSRYK